MNIGKTLDLKDYRIIKVIMSQREPLDCIKEINLGSEEIKSRVVKIRGVLQNI